VDGKLEARDAKMGEGKMSGGLDQIILPNCKETPPNSTNLRIDDSSRTSLTRLIVHDLKYIALLLQCLRAVRFFLSLIPTTANALYAQGTGIGKANMPYFSTFVGCVCICLIFNIMLMIGIFDPEAAYAHEAHGGATGPK
jgi:hypothetical protein